MINIDSLSLLDLITLASIKQAKQQNVFEHRNNEIERLNDSWIYKKLLAGVNKSLPLNENQINEAITLVKTGRVKDDLKNSLDETIATFSNIPTGMLGNPFSILTSPLRTIAVPITAARNTAIIFLHPKNRTFRLAILAYARLNAINITEDNINDVYNILDNPNSENFEELAKAGLETIQDEYGLTDLNEALQKFMSLTNTDKFTQPKS